MAHPTPFELLTTLRDAAGTRQTEGLPWSVLEPFATPGSDLARALLDAWHRHQLMKPTWGDGFAGPEADLVARVQEGYVNFYAADAVQPYVALAAKGPWLVTTHGAVLHDSGGYGMLGFGHAPEAVTGVLCQSHVIANIMTPSLSHARFTQALDAELGHTRPGGNPFHKIVCMNSGSEAVTVAMRIAAVNATRVTAADGRLPGARTRILALEGGFHGRTDRPAHASSSSRGTYAKHLRRFRDDAELITIPMNDVAALHAAFDAAESAGEFIELAMMEPVMGEGRPGVALQRPFYDAARARTTAHGTFLLIDSIQAGLRAHGVLSVVDYPGFQDAEGPDLEPWSKALNAAQFPLSVLGMSEAATQAYAQGIYGNTMTANPRALEVGCATLALLTPEVRTNIVNRGKELVAALQSLQAEFPELVTGVTGTGLLVSADLAPSVPIMGPEGIERRVRTMGLNVIHGGVNALRFTPWFRLTSREIAVMMGVLRQALASYAEAMDAA